MAANPVFLGTVKHGVVQIVNADGTANKTVVTAGASGSKVFTLYAFSDDTAARDLRVSIVRGGTTFPISTVNIPIGAGNTSSVPPVNLLAGGQFPTNMLAVDQDGQNYLYLENNDTLVVNALVAVTATKTITVHSDFGNF